MKFNKTTASSAVSGGATEAKQDVGNASLASIDTKLDSQATAAKQDTGNTSIASIDTKTPALVGGSVPVTGPLTDAQLRATPVPVSGTVAVSNPGLTDAELRATPVPVSGTVAVSNPGLTDAELRASAVPVTANAGTNLNTSALALETTQTANGVLIGAVLETAPATDTASSGLNGRLQRIAQRITSLIALLPASLGQKAMADSFAVTLASDQASIPVAATLSAETTKVIGTVNIAAAQTLATVTTVDTLTTITNPVPTKSPVNTNGSIVNTSLTATTASSASAPSNAVGFVLEAPSTNTDNIRWCIGGTASTTVGMLTEPGRDSGFIPCAATISVCATVSGTNAFEVQWILSV